MIEQDTVVRLRTLTEKSILKYGNKYADCRVGDLMNMEQHYLVWSYYHLSNITFTEDVLNKLEITDRIEKPGKDKDMQVRVTRGTAETKTSLLFIKWGKKQVADMTDMERIIHYNHQVKKQKAVFVSTMGRNIESRQSLAWRNQHA